jgi:hypothetical protein
MNIAAITLSLLALVLVAIGLQLIPVEGLATDLALQIALVAGAVSVVLQVITAKAAPTGKTLQSKIAQVSQVSATATASDQPKRAEAEVISFLAALQEKGRLVDFLMDDVTGYDDSQVGAAARVVHEGCLAALNDSFTIVPVSESPEGTTISVPANHRADEYRLTGKLSGQAPFNGTLVHRGWKTTATKLPQIVFPEGELPCIAPAEVEVR